MGLRAGVRPHVWLWVGHVGVGGHRWVAPVGRGVVRLGWCVGVAARPMGTGPVPVWWAGGVWRLLQYDCVRRTRLQRARVSRQWPRFLSPLDHRAWPAILIGLPCSRIGEHVMFLRLVVLPSVVPGQDAQLHQRVHHDVPPAR